MSNCLKTNEQHLLYHCETKLGFDKWMMMSALKTNKPSLIFIVKQQSMTRHVAPQIHIILIVNEQVLIVSLNNAS